MTTLKVLMVFNAISFVPFSQSTPLRSTRQLGKQVIFCLITKTYHKTEVYHKYNYELDLFSFSTYLQKKIHEAIKTNRFLELVGRKRTIQKKSELFCSPWATPVLDYVPPLLSQVSMLTCESNLFHRLGKHAY